MVVVPPIILTTSLFRPAVAVATGSEPEAVAIGDVNHDGRNDVVVTTSSFPDPPNDHRLHVFLQDGSGNLLPAMKYPVGTEPTSVDIGDVTGDGRNDVVVANMSGSIGVLAQNAGGTLDSMVGYPTSDSWRVRIGDFNNDGRLDVVSIGLSFFGSVFLQNASGALSVSFGFFAEYGYGSDLDVGDVNGDGLTDIVVTNGDDDGMDMVGVLLQQPTGGLAPPAYYDVDGDRRSYSVAVGDVTGDGRDDVVVGHLGAGPCCHGAVFAQNAGGTLDAPVSRLVATVPDSLAIADLTGEGRQDVLVAYSGMGKIGVHLQRADGSLEAESFESVPFTASTYGSDGLAVGDVNGDGLPDVALADYSNGLVILHHRPLHDLGITMTDSPDPVDVGSNLTYTITVRNDGIEMMTGVTVTDTLPAAISFVSSGGAGSCTAAGRVVTCALGPMVQGQESVVTIVVRPSRPRSPARSYRNVARVASSEPDGDPTNDETAVTTRPRTRP